MQQSIQYLNDEINIIKPKKKNHYKNNKKN